MKSPRSSIFIRILLATLVPLLIVFAIVVFTVNQVIYRTNIEWARDRTVSLARDTATHVEAAFNRLASVVSATAGTLGVLWEESPDAREKAVQVMRAAMLANPDVYCGWLLVEKGFDGKGREGFNFLRSGEGDREAFEGPRRTPAETLADPELMTWYTLPKRTGKLFINTQDFYDYRDGQGPRTQGVVACPIIVEKDGAKETVGVVGFDILYHQAFDFLRKWETEQRRIFLISESAAVLYSTDPKYLGANIDNMGYGPDSVKAITDTISDKHERIFEGVSPLDGQKLLYYVSSLTIGNADRTLYLLSGIPLAEVYRNAERSFMIIAGASCLGMILLAASVYLATRNIVKPIKRLTRSAEWIANGNLDVVLDDFGDRRQPRHEVDQLEISMKKMLEELNGIHELRLANMETEYEKKRLEQASEAKERFFANMSHEIRTPMNAILGMSDLLLNGDLDERQKKYARDIKLSADSLLGIINDILDISKLESGKFPLANGHYDLAALLDNVASMCGFLARDKGLGFGMDLRPDVPRHLFGDSLRLRQVLMNVIGNAVKFTEKGRVNVTVRRDGENLAVDVEDTGRGIREEDIPQLFQPFKRFEETQEAGAPVDGTGLGLSITSHLLELMGGGIDVRSSAGKGSVFHIRVPIVPGDPNKTSVRNDGKKITFSPDARVLVVDDNKLNLDVAAGMIGLYDIRCDRAKSGPEALEMAGRTDYDIIFMDHMMPGMDGVETTRRIRGLGGKHETQPIVALTANAVIGAREKLLQSGMNDFLSKPIVRDDLRAMLAKWIPAEKQNRPAASSGDAPDEPEAPAVSPADAERLERLRGIEGLAVDQGLDRVSGHADLYLAAMETIGEMRAETVGKLRESLAVDDAKAFAIEIHGLKGALASVGGDRLSARAFAMEDFAKAGDLASCRELLPEFLADFGAFADNVRGCIAGPSKNAPTGVDRKNGRGTAEETTGGGSREPGGGEALFVGLSELRGAFVRSDAKDARELLDALADFDFGEGVNARLRELTDMLEREDFSGAVGFVDDMMKEEETK